MSKRQYLTSWSFQPYYNGSPVSVKKIGHAYMILDDKGTNVVHAKGGAIGFASEALASDVLRFLTRGLAKTKAEPAREGED